MHTEASKVNLYNVKIDLTVQSSTRSKIYTEPFA